MGDWLVAATFYTGRNLSLRSDFKLATPTVGSVDFAVISLLQVLGSLEVMNISKKENPARLVRFFTSCLCIVVRLFIITGNATRQEISAIPPGFVYLAYLLSTAIIITWITKRLFDQHKVLELRFDIANMILFTSLFALPLATSNFFWMYFESTNHDQIRAIEPAIRIVST